MPVRLLLVSLTTALLGISPASHAEPAPPAVASPDKLWQSQCASCHGAGGRADTGLGRRLNLADLSSPAWKSNEGGTATAVRKVIAEGVAGTAMRGYGARLTTTELDALVAFVRGF